MRLPTLIITALVFTVSTPAQDDAPRSYDDLMHTAQEHVQLRQYDEAETVVAEAIEVARTNEERAAAIFMLATTHEIRSDIKAAMTVLEGALELDGGDWVIRCVQQLGTLAERENDAAMTRRAWERLVELLGADATQTPVLLLELARLAREAGEFNRSVSYLNAVLERDAHRPWHRQARESLAGLLLAQGQYERALTVTREVDDVTRRRGLEMRIAAQLIDMGDAVRGGEVARSVLTETPGHTPAMRLIYRAAAQRDDVDELRRELEAESEGDTPEPALAFLAEVARWEDDVAASLKYLRRLAQLRPRDADVRMRLGDAALEVDLLDEAEAALREALEIDRQHSGALTRLAEVLAQRGQTDEAVDLLKRAVNYDPAQSTTARSLDHALRRYSLHHERLKVIEQARQATSHATLMAYELAQAYIDLLRYEEATQELLAALGDDATPARMVGIELERLVSDELAGEHALRAIRRHVANDVVSSDAGRLALARVLLVAGDRERASTFLKGTQGAGLAVADLAREAQLRNDDDLAASLYATAMELAMHDDERAEVALNLAGLQRESGDWRAALETLEANAALDLRPEALLMRAELLTGHARRLEEAREAWQTLLACAGDDVRYVAAAREGMADWLFASARLDEAEQAYAELISAEQVRQPEQPWNDLPPLPQGLGVPDGALPPRPSRETSQSARAALRLAEISLRLGKLEEATERFHYVAGHHAQTPWANDALERLVFIRENLDGRGGVEQRYFEALALQQSGDAAIARDMLLEIAGTRDELLADDALVALAEMQADQGDLEAAAETWLSVADRFPDSLLAPQALLCAAGILRDAVEDPLAAAEALRRVIEDYPDSVAAHHARTQLELLPPPPRL